MAEGKEKPRQKNMEKELSQLDIKANRKAMWI